MLHRAMLTAVAACTKAASAKAAPVASALGALAARHSRPEGGVEAEAIAVAVDGD